ncbi:MAG: C1 family peptidase, partial [Bacteroidales bacterium]
EGSRGWFTPIRAQETCNTCYVFAPTGAVDARINLYYNIHNPTNPHHADITISEQEVWKCPTKQGICTDFGSQVNSFSRMVKGNPPNVHYFCQAVDYPYNTSDTGDCTTHSTLHEKVAIEQFISPASVVSTEEGLKNWLVTRGPISINIPFFPRPSLNDSVSHYVVLSGFKVFGPNDTVYKGHQPGDPDIVLDSTDSLVGKTCWIIRNSWGVTYGENGFSVAGFPTSSLNIADCYSPIGKVFWEGHDSINGIQYADEDDDGYYWWGLGPDPTFVPAALAALGVTADDKDCDDFNKSRGPYNLGSVPSLPLYECMDNCPDNQFITTNLTLTQNCTLENVLSQLPHKFIDRNIIIPNGVTVTASSVIRFHHLAGITIQPGGEFKIEQGARLTSSCNALWQGIKVQGTSSAQSSGQGKITVKGEIESALTAVETQPTAANGESGAIVIAQGATFHNNLTAISIGKYYQGFSISKISGCTFTSNDTLTDGTTPLQFIRLENLTTTGPPLQIKNCNFSTTN